MILSLPYLPVRTISIRDGFFGESCATATECDHGSCLKKAEAPNDPGFCSRTCQGVGDCPDGYKICDTISDSGETKMCIVGDDKIPIGERPKFTAPKAVVTTSKPAPSGATSAHAPSDAGAPPVAPSSTAPRDAGAPPADASAPPADAGAPAPTDAGTRAADAGGRPIITLPRPKIIKK